MMDSSFTFFRTSGKNLMGFWGVLSRSFAHPWGKNFTLKIHEVYSCTCSSFTHTTLYRRNRVFQLFSVCCVCFRKERQEPKTLAKLFGNFEDALEALESQKTLWDERCGTT